METKNTLDTMYNLLQEKMDYRLDEIEIQRTRRKIREATETAGIEYDKLECAVLDYGIAYERAGFRNGFRFAAQILSECMNSSLTTDNIPGSDPIPDTLPFES